MVPDSNPATYVHDLPLSPIVNQLTDTLLSFLNQIN